MTPRQGDADLEDSDEREAVDDDSEREIGVMMPLYAIDQSIGPINEAAAYTAFQLRLIGGAL